MDRVLRRSRLRACTACAATAPAWSASTSTATTSSSCTRPSSGSTGDLVFTVWPLALRVMDWTTRAMRTIVDYNAWHIAPDRAGRRILCDTNHPDEGLQIIDAASGARTSAVRSPGRAIRARSGANPATRWPRISPRRATPSVGWRMPSIRSTARSTPTRIPVGAATNRMVAFASDRTGVTQVYIASLG